MSNKNIKKMFLFLTLLVLFIGVVSAQEVSSDSSTADVTIEKFSDNDNSIIENKNIVKKDNTDNIKTGTSSNSTNKSSTTNKAYTTTAKTYDELVSIVNQAKKSDYTSYTINLQKGTYNATQKLDWDDTKVTSKLVINGNASIIDGLNTYQFLEIESGYTVTLKNITLKNFKGEDGGAIENEGTLIISNSKLTNNKASENGGAIYSSGQLTITKSQLNYNTAGKNGGAIYLDKTENCIITRNIFTGNVAGEDGGAIYIYNSYNTSIKHNNFTKNIAKDDGGAIANIPRSESYTYQAQESYIVPETYMEQYWNPVKNYGIIGYTTTYNYNPMGYSTPIQIPRYGYTGGYDYRTATRYVTKYRTVTRTGYHYYGSDTIIHGNNFIENTANDEAAAILISHGNVNITKNNFQRNNANITTKSIENNGEEYNKNVYKYSNTNPILDYGNTNIISNIFDDRLVTKLSVNKISTVFYGQNLTISGKLLNNNNPVKSQNLTITLNDKQYTTKTTSSGNFKINVTAKTVGFNNITISYDGNNVYMPIDYNTQVSVTKSPMNITITKITQKTYNDKVTITGKCTNALGTPFKNLKVTVNVNGKNYLSKTDSNGVYTLTIKSIKVGVNNVTVSHNGGKNYNPTSTKTTFKTVQRPTIITVNKIATTTKGKTAKITGKFTDNTGKVYQNIKVKITVNDIVAYVKTDSNGVYTYNYETTAKGKFIVTVSFAGNTNYKATSAKTTLSVA